MIDSWPAENVRMYLRFLYVIFTFYIDFGWFTSSFATSEVGWLIPLWIAAGTIWLVARIEANVFGGGRMNITLPWGIVFYLHLILFGLLGKSKTARIIINVWLALTCIW